MRVTDKMNQASVLNNITKNRTEMNNLQSQASTLKRVTKPSDDPLASTRVLQARTEDRNYQQFQKNIFNAKSFLEFTDQTLSELTEVMVRAKELAIQAASDTGGSTPREVSAAEVRQLFDQTVGLANRRVGERYIFSGYKTTTMPFDSTGNYFGDDGDIKIQTHKDAYVAMNISGDKVFLGKGLGVDGNARARGETPVSIEQVQQFKAKELQRESDKKEFEQTDVQVRGPAAVGQTSAVGHKDPQSGSEGINLFSALQTLAIGMQTNDKPTIQETIEVLDQAMSQVVRMRAEVGARMNAMNATFEGLQKSILDNKSIASQLEDADMFQVVSDINKTESTLKASMETSSKLLNQSLMDFLR